MIWFKVLLSPVGRAMSAIGGLLGAVLFVYLKGRAEGKKVIREEQERENQRRTENALEADRNARERINRGGLLDNDGHRRD